MDWTRGNGPWQDADSGHRVTAVRHGERWRFAAWGPDRAAGWDYAAWRSGEGEHWSGEEPQEYYQAGERIPQRRTLIGVFDSAEQAREACEAITPAAGVTSTDGGLPPTDREAIE